MMTELYKGEQERIAYEKQKRDMEYDITLSQINPHYLYNVLNTVVYLSAAGKNQDEVKIVHSLIYTLHETLKVGDGNVETTIEKELELTKCYLDIQRYRYPDVFQVEVKCEEGLKDSLVPKTMIQPLVENAILHGILPTEASGKIWIIIQKQGGKLCVMVKDEGIGVSKEQLKRFKQGETMAENKTRKHIGVENVRDRIRYLYGEGFGMEIQSTCGGSSASSAAASSAAPASSAAASAAADGQKFTIGICQLVQHAALDAATQGFEDALTASFGENVTFDFQNAQGDSATCATITNGFVSSGVDLIMANATPALQAAQSATDSIPVLGTFCTEYGVALGLTDFDGTVGGNISGTSDLAPLDQQAEMIVEWMPEAKKVGLLYCSAEANSQYQVDEVQKYLEEKGGAVIRFFCDVVEVDQ